MPWPLDLERTVEQNAADVELFADLGVAVRI
jgi:hypothetical protein